MGYLFHRWTLVALLGPLLVALAVAGCGESSAPSFDGIPEGATVIDQDGLKFKPNSITVTPGTRVYFTNSERAPHNVVLDGEDLSGKMEKGDVFAWTFDDPGEYRLSCAYHPQMRVTVTVDGHVRQ
ncbi:MAG: hypothetical protein Kow0010_03040 [Dehalococcoidia bacterium]